jgi:thiamine pyrophosphokinase
VRTRRGKHALIIANGDIPGAGVVRALARAVKRRSGLILCADGGSAHAMALGIRPSVILGDLDSLPRGVRASFPRSTVIRYPDQESTDLEKAVRYCIAAGCASADIVGATGGRIDHTAGALGCLRRFGRRISLRIIDRAGELRLLRRRERIPARRGEAFSLIPLGRCRGIVLTGALYPLAGESLEPGVREGISNRALGGALTIRHATGTLLLYRFRPGAAPRIR